MKTRTTHLESVLRRGALPAVAIGVLTLAGCGSSASGSSTGSDGSASAATTVSLRDTGDGQVLATSDGRTLYVSDQEKHEVLCASSACEAIWMPLTVSSGEQPTAPGGLSDELSTVTRPDGSSQVALDGRPLYTFSFDRSAGQVNGDGLADSFDGTDFTWHMAVPGVASPGSPAGSSGTSSPSGDGGYGY